LFFDRLERMLFSKNSKVERIENQVIELLKSGSLRTTVLITILQEKGLKPTRQAVYRVLRSLCKSEIVVIYNRMVSLNMRWLEQLASFADVAEYFYDIDKLRSGSFVHLREKEKITYTFNSLRYTDAFWNHALYVVLQIVPKHEHWFAYNPHAWFFIARKDEELSLLTQITKQRLYLLTAGGRTHMDKVIQKLVEGKRSQYHTLENPLFVDRGYYINILGDYIIEVKVDEHIAREIEEWYRGTKQLNDVAVRQLQDIIESEGKIELKISKNAMKAEKLRKRVRKYFYIPLRDKTFQN
jgi:hypothetical protein